MNNTIEKWANDLNRPEESPWIPQGNLLQSPPSWVSGVPLLCAPTWAYPIVTHDALWLPCLWTVGFLFTAVSPTLSPVLGEEQG